MLGKLVFFLVFAGRVPYGQGLSAVSFRRAQLIRHGINGSEWFAQSNDYSLGRLKTYTTDDDIVIMHKLGFDHMRLSLDPAIFGCWGPWSKCERVQFLHHVVDLALANDLAVIIDLHPDGAFKHELA